MLTFVGAFALSHFFFFQAEDGIRDGTVTGVQTCALPILTPAQVSHGPRAAKCRWSRGAEVTPSTALRMNTFRTTTSTQIRGRAIAWGSPIHCSRIIVSGVALAVLFGRTRPFSSSTTKAGALRAPPISIGGYPPPRCEPASSSLQTVLTAGTRPLATAIQAERSAHII